MPQSEGLPDPDTKHGLSYWAEQSADYDGVLGGFGNGTLPRVDALGSRQFLISLMPELCTVPSALRPLNPPPKTRRVRALDVGAGVGRVTSDTLLPLVDDVVVVEPVAPLIEAGVAAATAAESASGGTSKAVKRGKTKLWPGLAERTKSATFIRGTLQTLDPAVPAAAGFLLHRGGYDALSEAEREAELNSGFDVVWCQWCLGHLSDPDLVAFLGRAAAALRARNVKAGESESLVVIKENLCADAEDGGPRSSFDEQDSSLTRSDGAWKKVFADANLHIVRQKIQDGFPEGLYPVKM